MRYWYLTRDISFDLMIGNFDGLVDAAKRDKRSA
jgi:hypothetical protein